VITARVLAHGRLAPDLFDVGAYGVHTVVLEPVEPPRALGTVGYETRVLQHAQVTGDRRAADGQRVGELLHGAVVSAEQGEDGAPVRVAEGVEGIGRGGRHRAHRNTAVTVAFGLPMKRVETGTIIDAPERVWDVLADTGAWADWDSGVVGVEGEPGEGRRIKITSELNPKRSYPVKVVAFDRPRRMAWPEGEGRTRFDVREEFTGLKGRAEAG
jgi:hypothetical protein